MQRDSEHPSNPRCKVLFVLTLCLSAVQVQLQKVIPGTLPVLKETRTAEDIIDSGFQIIFGCILRTVRPGMKTDPEQCWRVRQIALGSTIGLLPCH